MDFEQISKDFHLFWQTQPLAVILLGAGFLLFVYLVIDTWLHKRRRRGPPLH